jgi:hypothetical protein
MIRITILLLVILTVPALADQTAPTPTAGSKISQYATFCEGQYALCIKAPCEPVVTSNGDGTFSISEANCRCDVISGWSMGPATCAERAPVQQDGRTYLMSTYSNFFNKTNLTLTCASEQTLWAWCYGAPCSIDPKDPTKAICTCPTAKSAARTLGGSCQQDACKSIWSAASFAEDWFANEYFAFYMKKNNPQVPSNPPALACPSPN